jgi:putative Mg2+ transporter-C (MgtC) family protein
MSPDLWSDLVVLGDVALAMLLGGLIGLERETASKPAGFRTHTLLAGAATLLVALAGPLLADYETSQYADLVRADPNRIVEAVVTAIGFIGAGTIFRAGRGGSVEGLTTAASLLMAGAMGIAVALHRYLLAAVLTLLVLAVLRLLGLVDRLFQRRRER